MKNNGENLRKNLNMSTTILQNLKLKFNLCMEKQKKGKLY